MFGVPKTKEGGVEIVLHLIVLGEPAAKARPRVVKARGQAGKIIVYTPDKTVAYMDAIRDTFYKQYTSEEGCETFEHNEPLGLDVTFYLTRPKSAKKRKYPHVKPDTLNFLQSVQDALQGFALPDDAAFVQLVGRKMYGDPPRTEIRIWSKGGNDVDI